MHSRSAINTSTLIVVTNLHPLRCGCSFQPQNPPEHLDVVQIGGFSPPSNVFDSVEGRDRCHFQVKRLSRSKGFP